MNIKPACPMSSTLEKSDQPKSSLDHSDHGFRLALWKSQTNRNYQSPNVIYNGRLALWKSQTNRNYQSPNVIYNGRLALWKSQTNRNFQLKIISAIIV